jgi:asparagine synthetase B (glutamine-hydrolysing)
MLPDAVRASDEPFADLTIVPLLAVLRLARPRQVALSGEGSMRCWLATLHTFIAL